MSSAPFSRNQAIEVAVGAAWLLGIAAALHVVELFIGNNPLVVAVLGAVIVDVATAKAGLRWNETERPLRQSLKALAQGAAVSLAVVAAILIVAVPSGLATAAVGHPTVTSLLSVGRAGAIGVRDELLFHGLVLMFARRANISDSVAVVFAAIAGAVSVALVDGATGEAIVLTFMTGAAFASLYARRRTAWLAIGAHAGWVLFAGAALRDTLLDVRWSYGMLSENLGAWGLPTLLACAAWLVALSFIVRRVKGVPEPAP